MRGRASSNSRYSAGLRPALPFGNRCEHQQDGAVREIGTSNDLLDAVEHDGSGGGKQNFVLIGEQPTGGKGTAARQTAEGVRQPGRQAAEIVEGEDVAIAGSDEQLPLIAPAPAPRWDQSPPQSFEGFAPRCRNDKHGLVDALLFLRHTSTAQNCGALSSGLRSPYWGLSGATNWELIQPFQRVFSTWTQSPSRPVAVNCVPLGAVPRTGAFAEGADLMLTPGRCKKTRSGFCAVDVVWGVTAATWGEAAAVSEAATSGEGTTPDAPGDGSATVGAGCT
jgi:hypothetical protein